MESESRAFLEALYADTEGLFATLFTLPGRAVTWFADPDDAARAVAATGDKRNVYASVALARAPGRNGQRIAATPDPEDPAHPVAAGVVGFVADLDFATPTKPDRPPDEAAARQVLAEVPCAPSLVVHSGHGVQAWWLFREPWTFADDAERERAADLSAGWQARVHQVAEAHGWRLDAVGDLARIMRVAGTVNVKDPKHPVPVRLLSADGPRYSPGDLAEWGLPTKRAETPVPPAGPRPPTADLRDYVLAAAQAETERVARAPEGSRNATLNAAAFSLGTLVGAGALPREDATRALEVAARQCGLPDDEARRTIASGLAAGEREPRDLSGVGTKAQKERKRKPPAGDGFALQPSPPESSLARADARKLLDTDLRGAHPASDVGLGRLLAAIAKDRLMWTDGRGWLAFDGKRWAPPAKSATGAAAKFFPEALLLAAAAIRDDGDRRAAFTKSAQQAHRERAIAAALNLAAIDLAAQDEDLDKDPWALTVANGTVDLRTGQLRPHSPADLITRLAPVAFDPEATAPVWAEFLATVLPDPDVRAYLRRAIGYTLTGTTRERCLWICHGRTRSGRTTLFETLRDLLGEYARDVSSDAFLLSGDRDDDARAAIQLVGVRMACAAELGEERTLRENLAKLVTGGQDRIPARAMYRDVAEYRPEAKLFLRTNHRPRITGTDEAIWSRVRLIEFPWQCPEQDQDRDLGDKLAAEHPGILNWALRGTAEWLTHGLGTPTAVAAATSRYRGAEDVLADWLAEHTAACGETLASLLYANYRAWAEGQGFRVVSAKAFGLGLADRGFEVHRGTRGVRYWRGLSLKGAPYITRGRDPEDQPPQGEQPEHRE